MPLLSMSDVTLRAGGTLLVEHGTLTLERGERVCLVGRNGEGKSTLLRLLAGELRADAGEVARERGTVAALLPQVVPERLEGRVGEVVLGGARAEWDASRRELAARRAASLSGLDWDAPCGGLSGGMRRRIWLARALACEPDVLLLDEPTNHLDTAAIEWLENLLRRRAGATLFVTHDRAFLRHVATRVAELDRGRLASWGCGYDEYVRRKEAWLEAEERRNAVADKKLAAEEAWLRRGVKARRTRDEGRVRALERLRAERAARRERTGSMTGAVQEGGLGGRRVLRALGLGKGYGGRWLFRGLDLEVMRGDKLALTGPNGCGKSTLLRVLLGEEAPDEGTVERGTGLEVAYFDQLREQLKDDDTVFDAVAGGDEFVRVEGRRVHVAGYLERFLFRPERLRSPVRVLSGGERSRLMLAKLFTQPANVLVLDEPTNDLDLETLEVLEAMLVEFGGTVLLVSHDREFIDRVATGTLAFEGGERPQEYAGGYSDWLRQRKPTSGGSATAPTSSGSATAEPESPAAAAPAAEKRRKLGNRERKELEALPEKIAALESDLEALQAQMADAAFYRQSPADIRSSRDRASALEAEIAQLYSRWEALENAQSL